MTGIKAAILWALFGASATTGAYQYLKIVEVIPTH